MSYGNYSYYPQPQPQSCPYPHPHLGSPDRRLLYPGYEPRRNATRRFFGAFFVAGLIWLMLTAFIESLRLAHRWARHGDWLDSWYYSVPPQVSLDSCVQGAEWTKVPNRMAAETSFELPLSSDTLFLLSRGDRLDGTVKVETSRYQASGFASVHVLMRYWFPTAVERTKACLVSRGINEDGVGLFAPVYRIPGRPGWDYQLSFEITVTLPENAALNPLVIKNFETDVPNGRHDIADIGSRVLFETISLKGTNAGFESKSLTAQHGYIYTTNGRISGKFSTNDTLRLVTSDGRITANVDLQSDSATARPKLEAITKDGRIETDINLISRVNGGRGGSFDVVTTTKDAQLDVKFPKSPVDSTLNFIASTKDARASVTLNPAYEGTFDLHTSSHSKVNIDLFQGVDPAGKNRDRHIAFTHQNNNEFVGRVSWDPRNSYRGSVVVRTNAALYARI